MARRRHIRWDRVAAVFGPPLLLILLLCVCCKDRGDSQESSLVIRTPDRTQSSVSPLLTGESTQILPVDNPAVHEYTIVLDAGHGGNDGGATNQDKTRVEKDDNLRLTLATRDELLAYPHVRVLLTRETDEFVSLDDRCTFANNSGADFFISLHRNSATDGEGVEIWVNNNNKDNKMDKLLGGYIMDHLAMAGVSNNRGVQLGYRGVSGNYQVNRDTKMPSCLVEMGFMTSDKDNRLFDAKLNDYAKAIAEAVIELGEDQGIYSSSEQ